MCVYMWVCVGLTQLWTTVDYAHLPSTPEPSEEAPPVMPRRKGRHTPRTRAALAYHKLQQRYPPGTPAVTTPTQERLLRHRRVRTHACPSVVRARLVAQGLLCLF
jgi:hypothetical protein